jgi:rhodanese-related sulfurtransferase
MLLIATILASLTLGCSKSDPPAAENKLEKQQQSEAALASLTVDEVDAQLAAHQIVAVDCNDDMLRKKLGVLPGAVLVSDDESYAASELPADKATKLVFYCHDEG